MKTALLASLMVVCLSGCSAAPHSGQIFCKTIQAKGDGVNFHGWSGETYDDVFEYKNRAGDVLYTDYMPALYYYDIDPGMIRLPLKVYATKDSEKYVEYDYQRNVGSIAVTKNYYLDLKTRTVESEFIYSDAAISNPRGAEDTTAEEAYECAKKDYYHLKKGELGDTLYLDETPKGLECHIFETYGEEVKITYTEPEDGNHFTIEKFSYDSKSIY